MCRVVKVCFSRVAAKLLRVVVIKLDLDLPTPVPFFDQMALVQSRRLLVRVCPNCHIRPPWLQRVCQEPCLYASTSCYFMHVGFVSHYWTRARALAERAAKDASVPLIWSRRSNNMIAVIERTTLANKNSTLAINIHANCPSPTVMLRHGVGGNNVN